METGWGQKVREENLQTRWLLSMTRSSVNT